MPGIEDLLCENTALITIDVQNDFIHERGSFGKMGFDTKPLQEMMPTLLALVERARKRTNMPVIHVRWELDEWTLPKYWRGRPIDSVARGSWGAEFYELEPRQNELVLPKYRFGAFSGSVLPVILRNLDIKTIVVAGVVTNVCVETTVREAFHQDYNVITLSDCTAAYTPAEHAVALSNMKFYFGTVATSAEVIEAWDKIDSM